MRRRSGSLRLGRCVAVFFAVACAPEVDPDLVPDELLRSELGLTELDRVYRVSLSGGESERADPAALSIESGVYVQFITTDWLVHEVVFDADSLGAAQREFLERTDQVASPPLIDRASRYLLSFVGAPPGRYTYRLEGNAGSGRGVIVVGGAPDPR